MANITGVMIEEIIMESYHKAVIEVVTELEKITDNTETLGVACQLVCTDSFIIADSNNAKDLKEKVIEAAKDAGDIYAGINYNECAFLAETDEDFEGEDTGLSWVNFDAIWTAFENVVKNH